MKTGEQIEALYNSAFEGEFPYEDCRAISRLMGRDSGDLIPELDWYFDNISGYSSSASRLLDRSPEELGHAVRVLSKDFFQYFPEEEAYRILIDPAHAPRLHKQMRASEELRVQLLGLLREYSADPNLKDAE